MTGPTMRTTPATGPAQVLLVEDNPGDIRLIQEALRECKLCCDLSVVENGVEALAFLRRLGKYAAVPRPQIIVLDLNLPRKDGREVLAEIKRDHDLKRIPVAVLTTSRAEEDILNAYDLHANCYICKPVNLDQFINAIRSLQDFWFTTAKLPSK